MEPAEIVDWLELKVILSSYRSNKQAVGIRDVVVPCSSTFARLIARGRAAERLHYDKMMSEM